MTVTIDDRIAKALKALAHRTGKPFDQVANETLQKGLLGEGRKPRPYRLKPVPLGGPMPGVDIDKALRLSAAIEDAAERRG
jgi:hypothetical protein